MRSLAVPFLLSTFLVGLALTWAPEAEAQSNRGQRMRDRARARRDARRAARNVPEVDPRSGGALAAGALGGAYLLVRRRRAAA